MHPNERSSVSLLLALGVQSLALLCLRAEMSTPCSSHPSSRPSSGNAMLGSPAEDGTVRRYSGPHVWYFCDGWRWCCCCCSPSSSSRSYGPTFHTRSSTPSPASALSPARHFSSCLCSPCSCLRGVAKAAASISSRLSAAAIRPLRFPGRGAGGDGGRCVRGVWGRRCAERVGRP